MNRSERERAGFPHLRLTFQKEQKKKEKKRVGQYGISLGPWILSLPTNFDRQIVGLIERRVL